MLALIFRRISRVLNENLQTFEQRSQYSTLKIWMILWTVFIAVWSMMINDDACDDARASLTCGAAAARVFAEAAETRRPAAQISWQEAGYPPLMEWWWWWSSDCLTYTLTLRFEELLSREVTFKTAYVEKRSVEKIPRHPIHNFPIANNQCVDRNGRFRDGLWFMEKLSVSLRTDSEVSSWCLNTEREETRMIDTPQNRRKVLTGYYYGLLILFYIKVIN